MISKSKSRAFEDAFEACGGEFSYDSKAPCKAIGKKRSDCGDVGDFAKTKMCAKLKTSDGSTDGNAKKTGAINIAPV